MRAFAEKPAATGQLKSSAAAKSVKGRATRGPMRETEASGSGSTLPWVPPSALALQAKLSISQPSDPFEREADRVAEQVMQRSVADAPPEIHRVGSGGAERLPAKLVQRLCPECEESEVQRTAASPGNVEMRTQRAEAKVDSVQGGDPLSPELRRFFEPRFGADFGRVRVHTDDSANTAAQAVGALAFTRGADIVFRRDHYSPGTFAGRRLLAHELTHVVQQGSAPTAGNQPQTLSASRIVQCYPGDGMLPPGDCGWGSYLALRGSVETAKAITSMLGACSPTDSCLFLATKIAAITAEIAARVALDTTCFKGGDTGHRQQVQDKINMLNRCYRFFSASNCSPELVAAMAVVVEQARAVVAAAAIVVAIAAVVALVAAIIALLKLIAAAAAAASAGAAVAAAAAAMIVMLGALLEQMTPESAPDA